MKSRIDTRRLTQAGLMAAIIALLTAYIKVTTVIGFIHLGDGPVILAGVLLGPFGAVAAALGSALGDVLAGFPYYLGFSAVIKGVMALIAAKFVVVEERVTLRNMWRNMMVICSAFVVMLLGYLIADTIVYTLLQPLPIELNAGHLTLTERAHTAYQLAVGMLPGNMIQASAGLVISGLLLNSIHRFIRIK